MGGGGWGEPGIVLSHEQTFSGRNNSIVYISPVQLESIHLVANLISATSERSSKR